MTRKKQIVEAEETMVEEPQAEANPITEWAQGVLSNPAPRFSTAKVTEMFRDAHLAPSPGNMIEAFCLVAKSEEDIKKGAMFMRRFVDQLWAERLEHLEPELDSVIAPDFKFNSMPKGNFNPRADM